MGDQKRSVKDKMELIDLAMFGLGMILGGGIVLWAEPFVTIWGAYMMSAGVGAILIIGALAIKQREDLRTTKGRKG